MRFGEKLQKLRKQSGLSQEQLAAQLTVSRQNVLQLSRIFDVSCDYLLRDEVDEPGAALAVQDLPQPAQPRETHLDRQGWTHNAFALSLGMCALGLVTAFMFYRFRGHTVRPLAIGFMVQLLGVVLFELAIPRMGDWRNTARLSFYAIACWLVLPIPVLMALNWGFNLVYWNGMPLQGLICYFAVYLLLSAAVTTALLIVRRHRAQT